MDMVCRSCNVETLSPIVRKSPFWIIKDSCTQNEVQLSTLFILSGKNKNGYSQNTTSYYLMKELGMVGLGLGSFSLSALWLHVPSKSKRTKEERSVLESCFNHSLSFNISLLKEHQAKVVLLAGPESTRAFTGFSVKDVGGLVCKSDLVPEVPVFIPCPDPDKIMSYPIGELRNSLKTLAHQIRIYKEYTNI